MSRRAQIVGLLREKLINGEFSPGESIPEESLAAEFKVSRTPIREALIILQNEGLAVNESNRGFRFEAVSIERIRSYFELARSIYGAAGTLAFERSAADEIAGLTRFVSTDEAAQRTLLMHFRLIEAVLKLSRNDFFRSVAQAAETYHCFVRASVLRNVSAPIADRAALELREHDRNIIDALQEKSSDELKHAIENAVEGSRVFLLSHLI